MSQKNTIWLLGVTLALTLYPSYARSGSARPGWSKALVWPAQLGDRISPAEIDGLGVEHVRDYESFTLVRVPTPSVAQVAAEARKRSCRLQVEDKFDTLFMPGAVVDTRSPVLPGMGVLESYPGDEGLYVVQFDGPLTTGVEKELIENSLRYVDYVPYNGILVFGKHKDVARLADTPHVQWASIYHPAFRAQPKDLPAPGEARTMLVQLVDIPSNEGTWARLRAVNVGPERSSAYLSFRNVWIEASSAIVPELLADPYVVAVEYPGKPELSGEREAIAATTFRLSPPTPAEPYQNGIQPYKPGGDYRAWLSNRGVLYTSDYRIAFADTGLTGYHADITPGRSIGYQSYVPGDPDAYDFSGHGTAVVGVAVGDPTGPSNTDGLAGYFWGMGLAPKTAVFSQRVFGDGFNYQYMDQHTLANDAYSWGCTVQNNSWNYESSTHGTYNQQAQEFDTVVRDTNGSGPVTPMPVTFSAGNILAGDPGQGRTMVTPPATAKNVLAVGASESFRDAVSTCDHPSQPPDGWKRADSFKNVAWLSRRGTIDGRFKPDIIAPGTLVSSTYVPGWSAWCVHPPATPNGYGIESGTSFAAPQAAAAYVLLRKKRLLDDPSAPPPSPAMLKAAIIGNALSVKGGMDKLTGSTIAARPNQVQGFGRLYLGDALAPEEVAPVRTYVDETSWTPFTGAGQTRSRVFTVQDTSKPTVLVVAWTDQPGGLNCNPCLKRDINMWIQTGSPAVYYTGNKMNSSEFSYTQTTPTWDDRNNVEMIVIEPNALSQFTLNLTTTTYDIGWPDWPHQPFAVFASNAQ